MAGENLTFHVIVNRPEKSFSIDGPDGPNGVWLHFEMNRVARLQGKQLRDFDRAGSGCLNRISASISGAPARVRLPCGMAAG